jgi:hypothetical protein
LIQEEHDHITSYERGRLPEVNSMYFPAIRHLSARIG